MYKRLFSRPLLLRNGSFSIETQTYLYSRHTMHVFVVWKFLTIVIFLWVTTLQYKFNIIDLATKDNDCDVITPSIESQDMPQHVTFNNCKPNFQLFLHVYLYKIDYKKTRSRYKYFKTTTVKRLQYYFVNSDWAHFDKLKKRKAISVIN